MSAIIMEVCLCLSSADSGASGGLSMGSLPPLAPGESVTVPDDLLQTCGLRPVIFKGKISTLFCFSFDKDMYFSDSIYNNASFCNKYLLNKTVFVCVKY